MPSLTRFLSRSIKLFLPSELKLDPLLTFRYSPAQSQDEAAISEPHESRREQTS